ncbi:hypothetical protein BKA70DRAFT_1425431 [Coprinopsis sp. MPI-PUGE-AT-0042]|nr:hypothetical protein BKA70DRAFT_1425431 [Coprinopsis sp. MPI-PUGE-AT-0042]
MFKPCACLAYPTCFPTSSSPSQAFQRSYIDLEAFLNYEEKYKPCLSAPDVMPWPLDKSLMGGITESETEASDLYIMGIPFWLVRPAHEVSTSPDTNIGVKVDFEPPSSQIELEHFDPPFPPVFEGYPHRDMQRATQRIRRHWAEYVTPSRIITHQEYGSSHLESGPPQLAVHTPEVPMNSSSSSRSSKSTHEAPSSQPPAPPAFDPFKYLTPEGDNFPIMVSYWRDAIKAIQPTTKHPRRVPSGIGYFLPDPKLFTTENRAVYQVTWLAIRIAHLHAVDSNQFCGANNQHWRLALYRFRRLLQGDPDPGVPAEPPADPTSSGDRKRKGRRKPDNSRTMNPDLESMLKLFQSVTSVQWFDSVFQVTPDLLATGLPATVSAELYWELCEVGFHLELTHLDQHLLPDVYKDMDHTGDARDLLVRSVFPMTEGGTVPGGYSLMQFPNTNGGLAATLLAEQTRAISAFRDLVKVWPDCPKSISSSNGPFATTGDFDEMRALIAGFYTQSFYNCYGRPPIVPHHLPAPSLTHSAPPRLSLS